MEFIARNDYNKVTLPITIKINTGPEPIPTPSGLAWWAILLIVLGSVGAAGVAGFYGWKYWKARQVQPDPITNSLLESQDNEGTEHASVVQPPLPEYTEPPTGPSVSDSAPEAPPVAADVPAGLAEPEDERAQDVAPADPPAADVEE